MDSSREADCCGACWLCRPPRPRGDHATLAGLRCGGLGWVQRDSLARRSRSTGLGFRVWDGCSTTVSHGARAARGRKRCTTARHMAMPGPRASAATVRTRTLAEPAKPKEAKRTIPNQATNPGCGGAATAPRQRGEQLPGLGVHMGAATPGRASPAHEAARAPHRLFVEVHGEIVLERQRGRERFSLRALPYVHPRPPDPLVVEGAHAHQRAHQAACAHLRSTRTCQAVATRQTQLAPAWVESKGAPPPAFPCQESWRQARGAATLSVLRRRTPETRPETAALTRDMQPRCLL
jgi:hypothetical protein